MKYCIITLNWDILIAMLSIGCFELWSDSSYIEFKIHVFVLNTSLRFYIKLLFTFNSDCAYLELVTIHVRIMALLVTVYV